MSGGRRESLVTAVLSILVAVCVGVLLVAVTARLVRLILGFG